MADRFNGAARCNTRRGVRRHHGRRHRFIPRCAAGAVPCGPCPRNMENRDGRRGCVDRGNHGFARCAAWQCVSWHHRRRGRFQPGRDPRPLSHRLCRGGRGTRRQIAASFRVDRRAVRAAWRCYRLYRDAGRRYSRRHGIRPDSRTEHLQRPQRPEEGHAAACQHRAQRTSWTAGRCSWRWPCSAGNRQRWYCIYYLGGDRPCAEILRRQCGRFQSQEGDSQLHRHTRINKGTGAQPSRGGAELRRQCACV